MDLASGDEDMPVRLLATPDRPKKPNSHSNSGSTTPASGYFSYADEYRYRQRYHDDDDPHNDPHNDPHDDPQDPDTPGLRTPSLLSSPSVVSSLGFASGGGRMSPLRNELSRPPSHHGPQDGRETSFSPSRSHSHSHPHSYRNRRSTRNSRDALARRLSQLAHQLTASDHVVVDDEGVEALTAQLDRLEETMVKRTPPVFSFPASPSPCQTPERPRSLDMRSPGESVFSSPASSLFRSRFSDLSASIMRARDREPEPEVEPDPPPGLGMTVVQAKKVIAESTKLNDELSQLVVNLQARQEESNHIHALLVERAERAAQRIIFLQTRIAHLEHELHENDDELRHLRICLKAVEIQMPPHPDKELQRCISSFKDDYKALKRKRASRSSFASFCSTDTPTKTNGSTYPGSTYPGTTTYPGTPSR